MQSASVHDLCSLTHPFNAGPAYDRNMGSISLDGFIRDHREELILRCKTRVATMANWPSTDAEITRGIPLFLDQLVVELRHESSQTLGTRRTAVEHGRALFLQGFTVSQVVHDYGNVCQSVTDLAVEMTVAISSDDFRTLDRCLDDAIAGAVSEYTRQERVTASGRSDGLRILIDTAILAFEGLQTGSLGVTGVTGALLYRSLQSIRTRLEISPAACSVDEP
jgi:hypothetical protein